MCHGRLGERARFVGCCGAVVVRSWRAVVSMACADQRIRLAASSRERPATSVSHDSASMPVALRMAIASRFTSERDSCCCSGSRASSSTLMRRPCRSGSCERSSGSAKTDTSRSTIPLPTSRQSVRTSSSRSTPRAGANRWEKAGSPLSRMFRPRPSRCPCGRCRPAGCAPARRPDRAPASRPRERRPRGGVR